jgi:iron complex outermembrane receptor protein
MKRTMTVLLAGSSVFAISWASSAQAQTAQPSSAQAQQVAAAGDQFEDVVVTARRRSERLQDVPVTVNAVSADQIEKLDLFNMADITNVVTGLQIQGADISMRGVSYNTFSEATTAPTVATYINDAPVNSVSFVQNLYDVGQVEVLRGPQGTLHGISTPSGAITFTTRKPEMDEFGGSANVTASTYSAYNLQFALNVPIIDDMLAVRVAGLASQNEGTGAGAYVTSVNSNAKPRSTTTSERVSVLFQPSDNFTANIMYEHIYDHNVGFGTGVFGTGAAVNPITGEVGYNGPTLSPYQRHAVASGPNVGHTPTDIVTGQLDWTFGNQKLSYVGSWQNFDSHLDRSDADTANLLPGYQLQGNRIPSQYHVESHELRLTSQEPVLGVFDYVVGAFHAINKVVSDGSEGVSLVPGSLGANSAQFSTAAYGPAIPNEKYSLNAIVDSPSTTNETSFFANTTAHILDNLEVSAGGRYIVSKVNTSTTVTLTPYTVALNDPPISPASCSKIGGSFGAAYPNACDFSAPSSSPIAPLIYDKTHHEFIYTGSISYHINSDVMIYANTGTSWRNGPVNIGVNNANNYATINSLVFQPPKKSTSYEGGVKWSIFGDRGVLNADVYQQKFTGLVYTVPFAVQYWDCTTPTSCGIGTYPAFNVAVPAKVTGIDADIAYNIMTGWSASGHVSWQDGKLSGAKLPCTNTSVALSASNPLNVCASNSSSSVAPPWNFNIESEYDHPIMESVVGFVRGLFYYQAANPNANDAYTIPAYGTLNLYLGAHSADGQWEASLFVTNLANTREIVSKSAQEILAPPNSPMLAFVPNGTGYYTATLTPPRVIGLNLRYTFGGD